MPPAIHRIEISPDLLTRIGTIADQEKFEVYVVG